MKRFIRMILLLAGIAGGFWWWFAKGTKEVKYVTTTVRDTVQIYKDVDNITHLKITSKGDYLPTMKEAISKTYYSYTIDTMLPKLKIAEKEIDRLIRINAKLEGEAGITKYDTVKGETVFENKYMIIKVNDSIAKYSYDATLDFVDYTKKNWLFGRDKYYTDISSPDTSFKIYGVQQYRRPFIPEKDRLKISINSGLSVGKTSGIRTGVSARFNPDGIVSPYVGLGREFYFGGRAGFYLNGGVELNIYRK